MKITVTRSGGFAGIPQTSEVATESLGRDDAAPLEALATALSDGPQPSAPGADQYRYDVTVGHAGGSKSYTFAGEQNPAADLIARVRALAKQALHTPQTTDDT
jgi:hypothetical protein